MQWTTLTNSLPLSNHSSIMMKFFTLLFRFDVLIAPFWLSRRIVHCWVRCNIGISPTFWPKWPTPGPIFRSILVIQTRASAFIVIPPCPVMKLESPLPFRIRWRLRQRHNLWKKYLCSYFCVGFSNGTLKILKYIVHTYFVSIKFWNRNLIQIRIANQQPWGFSINLCFQIITKLHLSNIRLFQVKTILKVKLIW